MGTRLAGSSNLHDDTSQINTTQTNMHETIKNFFDNSGKMSKVALFVSIVGIIIELMALII